ncbi:MAG: acyltransferase, partial [Streptomyces oryziradicis]|nr:acyltransferase [Actinacidiphila oryziradicis]
MRAALVQTKWTGDKESMTELHERYAREAAPQGAQIIGFQEVLNAPYFCQVQEPEHHRWAEPVPDGPTIVRMQAPAKEPSMVIVVLVFDTAVGERGVYICYDRRLPPHGDRAVPRRLRHCRDTRSQRIRSLSDRSSALSRRCPGSVRASRTVLDALVAPRSRTWRWHPSCGWSGPRWAGF